MYLFFYTIDVCIYPLKVFNNNMYIQTYMSDNYAAPNVVIVEIYEQFKLTLLLFIIKEKLF